ncbi:hypothetical protein [Petroclostridium sp. X23]|uniref:hypothetical protein n=1 Tax=Petroclostridium sp. X23 TaxID=3045146 RepID=UPI0024AE6F70|nr:hypothetical protein [Petroclostridium sp. X23]WHH60317.1 hypothetical protein QKW49_06165 [Petroclostridium sp. X23]
MKILRNATIIFIAAITLVITGNAMAAEGFVYMHEARLLNQLGLYDGISVQSFESDLGTAVNRETGITLLVKMFGKKNEVVALTDADMNKILSKTI